MRRRHSPRALALLLALVLAPGICAQRGDRPNDPQKPPPPELKLPPSPPLSPEDEAKTFQVAPGFEVELVAAEPLVGDPVFATFDPDGRLWVVEMRGFMPDVDGHAEDVPSGRVVVLEDTDGDGRMEKGTVFLDGLVLPRALALVKGGVLLIEPPYLRFWADADGDLEPEGDAIVLNGLGGIHSPEHAANGLLRNLDNWIYFANHPLRIRQQDGKWLQEPSFGGGQWGLSQDDFGRLFYNYNSDQLRCDLIPPHYAVRNPHFGTAAGVNHQVAKDQRVRPIRITPGINRGYQKGMLTPGGKLAKFTAACSPHVYRGHAFPEEFRGNAFVCEPAAHLVKRNILAEKDGIVTATDAYADIEFLASTDERFRPVHLFDGPDGALYVADMYRGVIQHRIFVTTYLRNQILERGLEQPVGLGRIWRIRPKGDRRRPKPRLSREPTEELVGYLAHESGWWRDAAQRLLVERQDRSVLRQIHEMLFAPPTPLAGLHALWTLEGLGESVEEGAPAAGVPGAARLRMRGPKKAPAGAEPGVREQTEVIFNRVLGDLLGKKDRIFRWTRALVASDFDEAASLLDDHAADLHIRHAAISGLAHRELEFLEHLVGRQSWKEPAEGRDRTIEGLAKCVVAEGIAGRIERLLSVAAEAGWPRTPILGGMLQARPARSGGRKPKAIRLDREPPALAKLLASADAEARKKAAAVDALLSWPGRPGHEGRMPRPLSAEENAAFEKGRALYSTTCAGCHQPSGSGWEGLAPPLAGSEWVEGSPARLARVLLHGLGGRVMVSGREYDMDMPAFGGFPDDALAGVLTFVRRSWDNEAEPVTPAFVADVRKATAGREGAWTAEELQKVP